MDLMDATFKPMVLMSHLMTQTLDNITQVKTAKHDIANLEGFELCVPYTQSFTKLHLNVFTSTGIPTKLNCTD